MYRHEMQDFFVECINEVKVDLQKRRAYEIGSTGGIKGFKNECLMGVEEFGAPERRKVIDKLMSNENVLLFLYDKMFPPEAGES
jgi:hypothetical protein